ncbi:hypothetical protein G6N74_30100 [Mesorhizobium sp. CGMCC 1.15528]|uniref:Uncharacterized protein n=1 Tax=Mesorhizobium zhangyense TaxID=1776730 RepID=A0A7C9VAW6_9HYPH|nr:hypothetical protein [Mesorhizobium zhangyense]NGN45305.1 hypothetical protein [Mesorhizobium zhangyense]
MKSTVQFSSNNQLADIQLELKLQPMLVPHAQNLLKAEGTALTQGAVIRRQALTIEAKNWACWRTEVGFDPAANHAGGQFANASDHDRDGTGTGGHQVCLAA